MTLPLPDCVTTYFTVQNGADIALLGGCFTPDATVLDEGHRYQGHLAIQTWLRDALAKFACTAEPLQVTPGEGQLTVRARVSGNFPGSPVELDHHFALADDKIQALEIH